MGQRRRAGLPIVLLAVMAVVAAPITTLTIHSHLSARSAAERQVLSEAERITGLAALRQADLLDGGRDLLIALTTIPSVQSLDPAPCTAQLRQLLNASPRFVNLGVADRAGNLRCSAVKTDAKLNFADRAWFRRTMATLDFAVGDYQIGRITHKPDLVFGYPVRGADGQVAGAAFAALGLAWLEQFASRAEVPEGGVLTITDQDGLILAGSPARDVAGGARLPEELMPGQLPADQAARTVETAAWDGVRRVYVSLPLGQGMVTVGLPTEVVYESANRELRSNLAILAGILLLAVVLAWVLGRRRVVTPARVLVSASDRLGSGDRKARVGPRYASGEMGTLGQAFDRMADALDAREQEITRRSAQLQAVIDNAPALVFMKDLEGRYLLANRAFEEITGIRRDDLVGKRLDNTSRTPLTDQLEAQEKDSVQSAGPSEKTFTVALDGVVRTFRAVRFPLCDENNSPYAVCGITVELTDQLKAEAEQEALRLQLDQAQRLEGLGRLAGGVAHDFNNLLSVILNYGDFALQSLDGASLGADPDLTQSIRDDVGKMVQTAGKATSLTRQLLIFARRDPIQPEVLDLNSVVEGLEAILTASLREDIALDMQLEPVLWPVLGDPARLEQVIFNLAMNARDAMPGGGTLTVRTDNRLAAVGDQGRLDLPPGPYVEVAVCDTGVGMSPEVRSRALEPFFTTKPAGSGTGLGLSIVFGIVSDAGGHLAFEPAAHGGTTVRVFLPVAESAGAARPPEETGRWGQGRGETILLVEDEPEVREVARRILAANGYVVLATGDALEARRLCAEHRGRIDLVLSDAVMPMLSGPDLLAQARLARPDVRSVLMSGYSEEALAAEQLCLDRFMVKPFTADELLRNVREVLDGTTSDHPTRTA